MAQASRRRAEFDAVVGFERNVRAVVWGLRLATRGLRRSSSRVQEAGAAGTASLLVRRQAASSATGLRSTPTRSTSTSTMSPCFIQSGGVRFAPTPPGVPVTITSPGRSGATVDA